MRMKNQTMVFLYRNQMELKILTCVHMKHKQEAVSFTW